MRFQAAPFEYETMSSGLTKEVSEGDVYLAHLSEVNKSNSVIANQNIYNNRGALLVKKGVCIDSNVADRIVKFKLLKPLEEQVNIENDINGERVYKSLHKLLVNSAEIYAIHQKLELDKVFKDCCQHYSEQHILRQKLTVLKIRMPEVYRDSMIAGWLSMAIANQMNQSQDQVRSGFIAGICHDIGMLHIDPLIINKRGELTPDEWRTIQAHVVVGQKILQHIPTLKKDVAKAVFEHHECCDGTGYPIGKFGSELGATGQIVGMSDSVIAVYARLQTKGWGLRDLIPFIQVNNKLHFYKTYEAIIRVLRSAKLSEKSHIEDDTIDTYVDNIHKGAQLLGGCISVYQRIFKIVNQQPKHRKIEATQQVWQHILSALKNSGIIEACHLRWLSHVKDERLACAYREIEDVSFMIQELNYHLQRLKRMLYLVINNETIIPEKVKGDLCPLLERVEHFQSKLSSNIY